MTDDPNGGREDAKGLNSTEYRHRLLSKLNCLIAVLEAAIGKLAKSIESDHGSRDRLERIRTNLENTLSICRRAKETLEARLLASATDEADGNGQNAGKVLPTPHSNRPTKKEQAFRCYVELTSIEEFRKFKELPAITPKDILSTDLDALMNELLGD
jgi:hypothetical protein